MRRAIFTKYAGGKSKYIPVTEDSLRRCHYKGAADSVAHYLRANPHSRLFSESVSTPFALIISFATVRNHEGTPEILVTCASLDAATRAGSFTDQSERSSFGEELMEENAERAISAVCSQTGASVVNYTAAPVFAEGNRKGRHQWLVEWGKRPADTLRFSTLLDEELRRLNSDYDAKRTGTIFLDPPHTAEIALSAFSSISSSPKAFIKQRVRPATFIFTGETS